VVLTELVPGNEDRLKLKRCVKAGRRSDVHEYLVIT